MTNQEALNLIKEIGSLRAFNKKKLHIYDSWFLYKISIKIYQARTLSKNQYNYLIKIYNKCST